MSRDRDPMSDATILQAGRELCRRNEGRLWCNIEPTERILMAYARPGSAWAAGDEYLRPTSVGGQHRVLAEAVAPCVIGGPA